MALPAQIWWIGALIAYAIIAIGLTLAFTPSEDHPMPAPARARTLHFIRKTCALLVLLIGLLDLLGWVHQNEYLTSTFHGLASMKANTALSFMLASAALLLDRTQVRVVLTTALFLLAGATLSQEVTGGALGIDNFFYKNLFMAACSRKARAIGWLR